MNLRNSSPLLAKLLEPVTDFAAHRALPQWSSTPYQDDATHQDGKRDVVLLADTFNTWFEPEKLRAARRVLEAAGYRVNLAQLPGERKLCCGRTYLATGMLKHAKREAKRMVDALLPWADKGVPVVGLEPSCLLTLRDEYKVLIPGINTDTVAEKAMLLEELIVDDHHQGRLNWILKAPAATALVHGHCHLSLIHISEPTRPY